jgi:chromosome segregation ATPase
MVMNNLVKKAALILAFGMATSLCSFAQSDWREFRHDRREIHRDRAELRHDYRELRRDQWQNNWMAVQQDRAEIQRDHRELRHDIRDDRRVRRDYFRDHDGWSHDRFGFWHRY